jgi:hypothetical protein
MNRIALLGAIALALPTLTAAIPARSQSSVHTTVDAQSGKPVRLGAFTGLKADCSQGPLPEIKVTQNPKHGVFVVRTGKLKTRRSGRCPEGTEANVQLVLYQSRANFVGDDSVSYEVRTAAGQIRTYSISLSVKAGAPSPKRPDTTEL